MKNSRQSLPHLREEIAAKVREEIARRERRKQLQEVAARCKVSLRDFIREAWSTAEPAKAYLHNWHIDAIADHLQAVTEGQIQNLLINIPPGHAKSLLVSVLWPAWVWARDGKWRGLFGSYASVLSIRDSVRCRALLDSEWYQDTFRPEWTFDKDQNQKAYYQNTLKGFRYSLSVGSSATGWRGDCCTVDDPLNAKEQFSDAAIEECIFWWDQVMSSRLNDLATGNKVIIMQRLSERDLSAHVLAQGGYEHLCLPTEFEAERRCVTSIGFQDPRAADGELLFPALFPPQVIEKTKRILGPQGFAGQHQQRPAPAEGGMFKRWSWKYWQPSGASLPDVQVRLPDNTFVYSKPVTITDAFSEKIQSWDMSFKGEDDSDFVVGQLWGAAGAYRYLLDQVRARLDFVKTVTAVETFSAQYPDARAKLIEDKANGPAIISMLQKKVGGLIPCQVEGSKYARAFAASPLVDAGNIYLPHPAIAPWVPDFIEELATFPSSANDDQVDAFSQAMRHMDSRSEFFILVA